MNANKAFMLASLVFGVTDTLWLLSVTETGDVNGSNLYMWFLQDRESK